MEQARLTGQLLKQHFEKSGLKFDKVVIECSPFIRTMMTASQIAKVLDIKDITINWQACEYLHKMLFWKCPLKDIEYSTCSESFQEMKQTLWESYSATFFEGEIEFHNNKEIGSYLN